MDILQRTVLRTAKIMPLACLSGIVASVFTVYADMRPALEPAPYMDRSTLENIVFLAE